jgi:hypothetical protein
VATGKFPVTVYDGTVIGQGTIIGTKKKGRNVEAIILIEFNDEMKELLSPGILNEISVDFNDRAFANNKQGEKQDGKD